METRLAMICAICLLFTHLHVFSAAGGIILDTLASGNQSSSKCRSTDERAGGFLPCPHCPSALSLMALSPWFKYQDHSSLLCSPRDTLIVMCISWLPHICSFKPAQDFLNLIKELSAWGSYPEVLGKTNMVLTINTELVVCKACTLTLYNLWPLLKDFHWDHFVFL